MIDKNDLTKKEKEYIQDKEWMYQGEVTASERPINSLLDHDFDFKQVKSVTKQTDKEEEEIEAIVRERCREKKFDNYQIEEQHEEEENAEHEEIKTGNSEVLTVEEVQTMIDTLNHELYMLSDMNSYMTEGSKNKIVTPDVRKKHKKNTDKELKKHKNVNIIE